jgi:shikimate kinase
MQSARRDWIGLVGMSGVGKTSAGRALAQLLGWSFIDLDELVSTMAGATVVELFESHGEGGFRQKESLALQAALGCSRVVVALGAGAPSWSPTAELLVGARSAGAAVLWLDDSDTVIAQRLGSASDRPLLAGCLDMVQAVATQRSARQKAYQKVSSARVSGWGSTPEEAAERLRHARFGGRMADFLSNKGIE